MDPADPVGLPRRDVDVVDRVQQVGVVEVTRRRRPPEPLVIAGLRHLQDPADHRDRKTAVGEFMDQPEPYFGRTFSLAK
jgi:hypothetical protein